MLCPLSLAKSLEMTLVSLAARAASLIGHQGHGVDARRAERLLPDGSPQHDPGLVSPARRQEVRQLHAAQRAGQASHIQVLNGHYTDLLLRTPRQMSPSALKVAHLADFAADLALLRDKCGNGHLSN